MTYVKIEHYCLSLLDNIYSEVEEVRLNDNLRIVRLDRLTDPRAERILGKAALEASKLVDYTKGPPKNGFAFHPIYYDNASNMVERWAETSNHALECQFEGTAEGEQYEGGVPFRCLKLFNDVLTSFRLLKPEIVGRLRAKSINPTFIFTSGETVDYEPPVNRMNPYIFLEADSDQLKSFFTSVCICDNAQIQIALGRLNRCYSREHEIDKLIDIMIAFEALYLKGENSELKFRLATRAAKHLGKNAGQSKNIFECVSIAYDIRSAVAHGSVNILKEHKAFQKRYWDSPRSMLDDLSKLLRKALMSILLDVGESFAKDFHAKLDDAIIGGEPFL